jgi:general secretion pathway protein L
VLVLPHRWLSWHAVALPAGRLARSAAGLAGLLEEQLLDDPKELLLALDPAAASQRGACPAWVTVCRREPLEAALNTLQAARLGAVAVVPELAPGEPPFCWAHRSANGQACLSFCDADGVLTLPLQPGIEALWQAWRQDHQTAPPTAWADADTLQDAESLLPAWSWTLQHPALLWWRQWTADWNLAQHEWRHRVGRGWGQRARLALHAFRHDRAWRAARWGVALAAVLPVVALPGLAWQARTHEAQLLAQRTALARQALPDVPVLLDPLRQVQQALEREQARTGQLPPSALERGLQWLGRGLAAPGITAIEFDGQRLVVQWATPGDAEQWRSEALRQGWQASSLDPTRLTLEGAPRP